MIGFCEWLPGCCYCLWLLGCSVWLLGGSLLTEEFKGSFFSDICHLFHRLFCLYYHGQMSSWCFILESSHINHHHCLISQYKAFFPVHLCSVWIVRLDHRFSKTLFCQPPHFSLSVKSNLHSNLPLELKTCP